MIIFHKHKHDQVFIRTTKYAASGFRETNAQKWVEDGGVWVGGVVATLAQNFIGLFDQHNPPCFHKKVLKPHLLIHSIYKFL